MSKLMLIMLHFGDQSVTKHSLDSLKTKIKDNEIVLVNNTPQDITELGKIIAGTIIINNPKNLGFASGVNQGIKLAQKNSKITHVLLLNNDLTIASGTLEQLLTTYNKVTTAGIVSPLIKHENGYDWGAKFNPWTGMVKHQNWKNPPKTLQNVEHIAGASMLIGLNVIDKVGLFDERFFLYYEDLDFTLRVKKVGFSIIINPDVVASHLGSRSTSQVQRLMYIWRSHFQFMLKYMPQTVFPTALLYSFVFYPLVLTKLLLQKLLGK